MRGSIPSGHSSSFDYTDWLSILFPTTIHPPQIGKMRLCLIEVRF